jgi:hypothetical protein
MLTFILSFSLPPPPPPRSMAHQARAPCPRVKQPVDNVVVLRVLRLDGNNLIAAADAGGVGEQSRLEEEEATRWRGTIIWPSRLKRFNVRAIQASN